MTSQDRSSRTVGSSPSSLDKLHSPRSSATARRLRAITDRSAAVVVWIGGLTTIMSIMGIFIYLFMEVTPLFLHSQGSEQTSLSIKTVGQKQPGTLAIGVDEYQEIAYVLDQGQLGFYDLDTGQLQPSPGIVSLIDTPLTAIGLSAWTRKSSRPQHS